jgi:hypothetical protein
VFGGRGGDGETCLASDGGQLSADDGFRSMDLAKVSKRDLGGIVSSETLVLAMKNPRDVINRYWVHIAHATTCTWEWEWQ